MLLKSVRQVCAALAHHRGAVGAHRVCIVTRRGSVGIPQGLLGLRYFQLRFDIGETTFDMVSHYIAHCLAETALPHHPGPWAAIAHHAARTHHHPSIPRVLLLRLVLSVSRAKHRS